MCPLQCVRIIAFSAYLSVSVWTHFLQNLLDIISIQDTLGIFRHNHRGKPSSVCFLSFFLVVLLPLPYMNFGFLSHLKNKFSSSFDFLRTTFIFGDK